MKRKKRRRVLLPLRQPCVACVDPMLRPGATAKPEKRYMQGATQGDIREMLQTGPP